MNIVHDWVSYSFHLLTRGITEIVITMLLERLEKLLHSHFICSQFFREHRNRFQYRVTVRLCFPFPSDCGKFTCVIESNGILRMFGGN